MKISCNALYTDLLEDLSEILPTSLIDEKSVKEFDYFPDMTTTQFRALHLAKSFFKKFEDRTCRTADTAALNKFLQSNIQCRDWSLRLESLRDELLVGLFKQEIYRFFNPKGDSLVDSFESVLKYSRTGPGASVGARGNDFYTKLFSSPLTSTSESLYSCYENYFSNYPDWSSAERQRLDHFGEVTVVTGNRLSFVPKNVDTSRVICTEPNLNMFFQLGLGAVLEKRLKSFFGIDLSVQQDRNRDLALVGSKFDSFSTIDLESASDTVGWKMIMEMFPRDVVTWFNMFRSPNTVLPDGSTEELHMMSSMGNGFTFPLQTLIFSCAVAATYYASDTRLVRPRGEHHGNFGVFGDDIIIEKEHTERLARLLKLLGFKVNAAKSFSEGPFRESCGGDFFKGHHVRGIYIKSLESQGSRFVAINRLNQWTSVSGIPLPKTVGRIMKACRFLPVPLYENDDAGIRVPSSMVKRLKLDPDCQSVLYTRWQSRPVVMRITEGGIVVPRGARKRFYNADGLFLAFLRGDLEGVPNKQLKRTQGTLGIRLGPARYHTKQAITPNWDWLPATGRNSPISQEQLIAAITMNIRS